VGGLWLRGTRDKGHKVFGLVEAMAHPARISPILCAGAGNERGQHDPLLIGCVDKFRGQEFFTGFNHNKIQATHGHKLCGFAGVRADPLGIDEPFRESLLDDKPVGIIENKAGTH
jgi:hypothetical protein